MVTPPNSVPDASALPTSPPTAPGPQYRRPKLSVKSTRLSASTLILIASIMLAVSMGVSWWGASVSGGGHARVLGFQPGSSYLEENGSLTASQTYISAGLVHVGQLYEAILGIGVLATLAGFLGAILCYLGAFGSLKSRKFLPVSLLITLISFVAALITPILAAVGQPGAFNSDSSSGFGATGCGPSPNPCTAFWGSMSEGGFTVSWGADVGWYLAIASAVLLVVAFLQLWNTRNAPYTRNEVWAASMTAPTATSGVPTVGPSTPPGPVPSTAICPRCGKPLVYVAQYSRWYCTAEGSYL
jgi:hypothetical protein